MRGRVDRPASSPRTAGPLPRRHVRVQPLHIGDRPGLVGLDGFRFPFPLQPHARIRDLAHPAVARLTILLAKFIVVDIWSAGLTLVIFTLSLVLGFLIHLPPASFSAVSTRCSPALQNQYIELSMSSYSVRSMPCR